MNKLRRWLFKTKHVTVHVTMTISKINSCVHWQFLELNTSYTFSLPPCKNMAVFFTYQPQLF